MFDYTTIKKMNTIPKPKENKLYRVYVGLQDKYKNTYSIDNVRKIISEYFDNFTLIKSECCYKGQSENSLIIEITNIDKALEYRIKVLCSALKQEIKQEAILLTEQYITSKLI